MYKLIDYYQWYCRYFQEFLKHAPREFVEYGGYQTGEPNGTASSLESLICFANLVERDDLVILDAGAGVSSFVLRKMFKRVISTDPHAGYLETVKKICGENKLSTDNFIVGLENCPNADYVYYDYGDFPTRKDMWHVGWEKMRVAMYTDDADDRPHGFPEYRQCVYNFAAHNSDRMKIRDCREAMDRYGRWGVIIEAK